MLMIACIEAVNIMTTITQNPNLKTSKPKQHVVRKHKMYIKVESANQINDLVTMAKIIWFDYFQTFFDKEVLLNLIDEVQSKSVILTQIEYGYAYYFIELNNERIGYFAYLIDSKNSLLFLSKIYLYANKRRNGIGKSVLNYLENICVQFNLKKLSLTVFHKNTIAIAAYQKWGFVNIGTIKRVLDNGLVLYDCKMEKYF